MSVRGGLSVCVLLTLGSCVQVGDRMSDAKGQLCNQVLAEHPKVSADPAYAEQRPQAREVYELRVAECYLEERRPEKALAFVRTWQEERLDKVTIEARANAQLNNEAECRAALERAVQARGLSPMFFVEYPEFRNYAGQDWFVRYALLIWSRTEEPPLQEFARKLMQRANEGLLPLEIAAADTQRPAGEWAAWVGAVQQGHMDRASSETLLLAEGVDVRNDLVDRALVSVEHEAKFTSVESTPTYAETYKETFVPNGRHFVVKFPAVNEGIVKLRTIVAFGRYAGRDSQTGWPILSALAVAERKARQSMDDGQH